MGSIKVFGLPTSTDVARVLTCLFEKELEFQLIRIDTYKGKRKVPEFLRLQDISGQVTFKDEEKMLLDSREICRYIADYPTSEPSTKKLLGTGILERASVEQWLQAESENFEPPSSALVFHLAFAVPMGINPDQAIIKTNEDQLAKVLDIYDQRLALSEYLGGDEFTLADLSHLPYSNYLMSRSDRGRRLFESRKNVERWWKKISSRSSWLKVLELQNEHPGPF
ncbi:glutathione S-transferase F10-like [Asparagus officinalis]|uniref:glutathione S-transferase F10-like n=1 Tax=Asparagus officinalis TaxID=4686 RepID=UPI00098E1F86|nr:glutathione S-transferase F10-like [Asparagus officinalis]